MQKQLSLAELKREIKVGDVVNGEHVVTKTAESLVYSGKLKIFYSKAKRNPLTIETVARDGKVYFKRQKQGGKRKHGSGKTPKRYWFR